MKTDYLALVGRMRRILLDIKEVVSRAELLMGKAQQSGDDGYLDGVALNLHGFYAGVEKIFEDIARTLEKAVPEGSGWHQDLLLQMAAEVGSIRPPVIGERTRDCLDEYRGFRHVVRNVYTFNLRSARLEELTSGLSDCYHSVEGDLASFTEFLEQLAMDED